MAEELIDAKTASAMLGYKNVKVFNTNKKQNKGFPKIKGKASNGKSFLYSRDEIEAYAKIKAKREEKVKPRDTKPKEPTGFDNELARSFLIRDRALA